MTEDDALETWLGVISFPTSPPTHYAMYWVLAGNVHLQIDGAKLHQWRLRQIVHSRLSILHSGPEELSHC